MKKIKTEMEIAFDSLSFNKIDKNSSWKDMDDLTGTHRYIRLCLSFVESQFKDSKPKFDDVEMEKGDGFSFDTIEKRIKTKWLGDMTQDEGRREMYNDYMRSFEALKGNRLETQDGLVLFFDNSKQKVVFDGYGKEER